jgi:ribosomal protein S18 acetylase RimI-like enzyme
MINEDINYKFITKKQELSQAYFILKEIRDNQPFSSFIKLHKIMEAEGYKMFVIFDGDELCTIATINIRENEHYGKFLYIYDLITKQEKRSCGFGSLMISKLNKYAKNNLCKYLVLNSSIDKIDAHNFYEREQFKQDFYALIREVA